MKTLEYYLSLPYKMEVMPDPTEGGYVASYPDLPGCLTYADTLAELADMAEDAKRVWLEAAVEEGVSIKEPTRLEDFSGQFKLRIPKELHRSLAEHAKEAGISMNQYCLYLLAMNDTKLDTKIEANIKAARAAG
ncbi:MAG: toxin-antitoxin system HicB family antitoxin [Clostridia bacterium]|nr:toxin-antitoxin system HicB family antitoxin [Clostridia bacterium]